MFPPVFATCSNSAAVKTALGTSPVRLYPFGQAPQDVALPYAVWQVVSGGPENLICEAPDLDISLVQVDVYAVTESAARAAAKALRDAIEPEAHIVAWRGESVDPTTQNRRFSFDVEWHVPRVGPPAHQSSAY